MIKIHQETIGKGKPIILVHGWAMHTGIWRNFAEQLAQHYRVTVVDLPGHGYSEAIDPFMLESISETLANAVVDDNSCWLGWSMGSTIAIDLAKRFPERVNALILMTGNPCFTQTAATQTTLPQLSEPWAAMDATVLEQFAEQLSINSQTTLLRFLALQVFDLENYKALLSELKTAVFECPIPSPETLNGGLELLKQTDLRAALSTLKIPVSAILGTRDALVPVSVGAQLQQLLPSLQLNVIDKAGHIPFLSHPQEVLSIIADFMERK